MPVSLHRQADGMVPVFSAQEIWSGSRASPQARDPVADRYPDRGGGVNDRSPVLDAVLALNAALIQRIGVLKSALDRHDVKVVILSGSMPGVRASAVPEPRGPRARLVLLQPIDEVDGPVAANAAVGVPGLTQRQSEVLQLVLAGHPSKNIAADLGISQRTVENHRAAIMRRSGATSLPALARMAVGSCEEGDCRAPCRHLPQRSQTVLHEATHRQG